MDHVICLRLRSSPSKSSKMLLLIDLCSTEAGAGRKVLTFYGDRKKCTMCIGFSTPVSWCFCLDPKNVST
eukprot:8952116-Karenia_brevis.AAC.1